MSHAPREPTEGPRRPRRGGGVLKHLPIVLGILLGAAAIAIAAVVLRNGAEATTDPPATTQPPPAPPPLPELRIVFPEGFTRDEMAARIAAVNEIAAEERELTTSLRPRRYVRLTRRSELPAEFAGDEKPRPLEGFLFPATYTFTPETTTRELVDMQLAAFRAAWDRLDLSYARRQKLTPYDVLTIASMIEGEVQVPRERALVAAVIYNRLEVGMPLGIDATLRYGLDIPPTRAIRVSELEDPTPYNTRIHTGLPPTPIGNPGLAAMRAAARPAEVDYVYFVRKPDCRSHFFTASEAEFLQFLAGPRC
jgi:UPF0755 protein